MNKFSHFDKSGNIRMVDVTDKDKTYRVAKAEGRITISTETLEALASDSVPKGNVLTIAKLAGIQAAKKTADLIPLCHPLTVLWIDLELTLKSDHIHIEAIAKTKEATGVEMEALTAVSVAALTIYDMCKSIDKNMVITDIRLVEKKGGKSDHPTDFRPKVGILTLSDSVASGNREDISGQILQEGFEEAGCPIEKTAALPDGSEELTPMIKKWIDRGVDLIVTTGGTGLGPRDLTIEEVDELFDRRLPGIEQALHAIGRSKIRTSMISRLAAGTVGNSIIVCLPGSPGAARDALKVLIPAIFHAFPIMKGEGHTHQE